jgi:hypothetical protein
MILVDYRQGSHELVAPLELDYRQGSHERLLKRSFPQPILRGPGVA